MKQEHTISVYSPFLYKWDGIKVPLFLLLAAQLHEKHTSRFAYQAGRGQGNKSLPVPLKVLA
jgi:hypothetical protein